MSQSHKPRFRSSLSLLFSAAAALGVASCGSAESKDETNPVAKDASASAGRAGASGSAGRAGTTTPRAGASGQSAGAGGQETPRQDAGAVDAAAGDASRPQPDAAVADAPPKPDKSYVVDITTYAIDDQGKLTERGQTSLLKPGDKLADENGVGIFGGEILLSPNGKFLYASVCDNSDTGETKKPQDHNYVAAFSVGADSALTSIGQFDTGGSFPRGMAIDQSGKWLVALGHDEGLITLFSVGDDGKLTTKWTAMKGTLDRGGAAGVAFLNAGANVPPFLFTQSGQHSVMRWSLSSEGMGMYASAGYNPGSSGTSFYGIHPRLRVLYSANDSDSSVTAFAVGNNGQLTTISAPVRSKRLDTEKDPKGDTAAKANIDAPVHFEINTAGTLAVTANYGGGLFVYKVLPTGGLEPASNLFIGYATHGAKFHPTKNVLYAAVKDSSKLVQLKVDPDKGVLSEPVTLETGFRKPRHITTTADGKFAFVINERSFLSKQR